MQQYYPTLQQFEQDGYAVVNEIFSEDEVAAIIAIIDQADHSSPVFRKTSELFAIRQFLKELPAVGSYIFTEKLTNVIRSLFGEVYFAVKSIYFDKPGQSNWFVAWHQDLTISVADKAEVAGFGPWTVKQNQFAVQPPLEILQQNFTIRIHLDDTNKDNGALRVVPGSHKKGIYRPETIDWSIETEVTCEVQRGGIMFMRPLLLHASNRTANNARRRVVHIEFSKTALPQPLQWSEVLPA
ncbi:phytanoyl-CoA dioxygenase family protein [Paraflavitalea sp. CAU 1676]|uniref:phytanoyl-CoA dioxygenase family protein n=1 Tax=Paraflavitalea sp. CAU 1676 TaxID=3032598 RepID=UPI0023DA67FA|nr:phytanoyl-CoA dioxygenase family protein [Paraflavitalea sp. CAU 1676]MDF2193088.1 phytanoyl-CoA dioxygenase family protein [Paraflavitalea sp. CAU 1676]